MIEALALALAKAIVVALEIVLEIVLEKEIRETKGYKDSYCKTILSNISTR
jgi:hypothetical protein